MDFYVTFSKNNGVYHIEMILNNEWAGGGSTGCRSYDEAYEWACKLARTKGGRVARFAAA